MTASLCGLPTVLTTTATSGADSLAGCSLMVMERQHPRQDISPSKGLGVGMMCLQCHALYPT